MGKWIEGVLLAVLAVLLVEGTARSDQTIYKWVDDQGVVHMTGNLGEVPEAYRGKVEERVFASPATPKSSPAAVSAGGETRAKGAGSSDTATGGGPSGGGEKPPAGALKPSNAVDKNGNDAAWWRDRADRLRDQKRNLEAQLADATKKIYSSRITEKDQGHREKAALEKELKQVKDQLDKLSKEVTAAGGDSAWVR